MADFYERMAQAAAARRSGALVPTTISRRKKGTLFTILDYLDRPRMTISEAVQAAMADEDVGEAALRGWKGRPQYGTLGEAAFPEAAEPGFQAEDIPAFAIDILTDPTTWMGPGAVKLVGKPLAKGALMLGAKALPKEAKILAELSDAAVRKMPRAERINMLKSELDEIGLTADEAFGRVWKIVDPETRQRLNTITSIKNVEDLPDGGLTILQEGIRDLQANIRPEAATSLNSLAQAAGKRWLPAGKFLRSFGSNTGKLYASKQKSALFNTDKRLIPIMKGLREITKLPGAKDEAKRVAARAVVEGLESPASVETAVMANHITKLLKDFKDDIIDPRHHDAYGNGLMVWDPITRTEASLKDMILDFYFPRRLPSDAFTSTGQKRIRAELAEKGWKKEAIDEAMMRIESGQAEKIGHVELVNQGPKKVGHAEFARTGEMIYEQDPLKVLPKYFHDIVYRQELGKQFGMNNELLKEFTEDLAERGIDRKWLEKLSAGIIGRNPYYDKIEKLMRGLGTFQAVSKLGVATSVANASQSWNQALRSGLGNFAKSNMKYMENKIIPNKELQDLGMLSLSRRAWGDISAMAGHEVAGAEGVVSRFGNFYIKSIGFPLTERYGRHIGAIGGDLEVQSLARKLRGSQPWYITGKKAWAKERTRLASELKRKYNVTEGMIGPAGQLSPDIIERAAWDAARNTMHAFDIGELPLFWQDPFWKMTMQFKSFIYKQSEFMFNDIAMPGIQWFATNGTKGDIKPLLRAMTTVPVMAELVTHGRDLVKSVPTRVVEVAKNYVEGEPLSKTKWDYKDIFWEDPDPAWRILSDSIYMGLFGIVGDMFESARMGRLADWLAGPTIGDIVDIGEAAVQGRGFGKVATQMIPGAFGIPYGADVLESGGDFYTRMMREAARRKLQ